MGGCGSGWPRRSSGVHHRKMCGTKLMVVYVNVCEYVYVCASANPHGHVHCIHTCRVVAFAGYAKSISKLRKSPMRVSEDGAHRECRVAFDFLLLNTPSVAHWRSPHWRSPLLVWLHESMGWAVAVLRSRCRILTTHQTAKTPHLTLYPRFIVYICRHCSLVCVFASLPLVYHLLRSAFSRRGARTPRRY